LLLCTRKTEVRSYNSPSLRSYAPLRDVGFDYEETEAFVDAVNSKTWKSVKIASCNGLINDVATACMTSNVESFHLQSLANVQTMYAFSFGIKYSRSLLHLSLSIEIDPSSASLWRGFARNTRLESLKLSGSHIHASAIGHIGFALRINRTLKSLSFDACYLEDNEMSSLLMALQDHPTLKQLSIQQNSCHTEGMSAISCLLNYNELEELDMSYLVRKKKTTPETSTSPSPVDNDGTTEEPDEDTKEVEGDEKGEEEDAAGNDSTGDGSDNEATQDDGDGKTDEGEGEENQEESEEGKIKNKSLRVYQLAGNG
jgi:hypothetical protein